MTNPYIGPYVLQVSQRIVEIADDAFDNNRIRAKTLLEKLESEFVFRTTRGKENEWRGEVIDPVSLMRLILKLDLVYHWTLLMSIAMWVVFGCSLMLAHNMPIPHMTLVAIVLCVVAVLMSVAHNRVIALIKFVNNHLLVERIPEMFSNCLREVAWVVHGALALYTPTPLPEDAEFLNKEWEDMRSRVYKHLKQVAENMGQHYMDRPDADFKSGLCSLYLVHSNLTRVGLTSQEVYHYFPTAIRERVRGLMPIVKEDAICPW